MLAFIRSNFRWIAGGFLLTFFSSFGQTYFISASIAHWQTTFDLSHGEFGRLYMFATLASALCLPFIGRLVDVVSAQRMVLIVIPVLAAATLAAGFAASITTLVLAIFVLRLFGQGMMTHVALTATGRWFVAQRGRAVSLVVLGHQGGEATIPLLFAALVVGLGYPTGWLVGAMTLLFVGLPLTWWAYAKPRDPAGMASDKGGTPLPLRNWTRAEVLRDPVFWVLLTGVLAPPFIGTTIFYHQNYLTALWGWPPQLFAQSLMLLAMTTVTCALISGAIIDRCGARSVLPWFLLPLAGSCFGLALSGSTIALLISMVLLGISYGISSTLFGALWPEVYGIKHLGSIRAVIMSAGVFASAAGPGITGTVIDLGIALPAQMRVMGIYCVLVMATMAVVSGYLRRRVVPA